ncbi:hypothetical protein EAI26_01295 [Lactobacillus sp. 0.1XD8-4]|uniref:hypothetical protein n=1 Tax=Lactobacillus taiwanensis TaxID=508451 RepID=UPI00129D8CC4|nr:hypothetical protein [Lactobacillus taiwanensis]MRN06041.1 hypothetical protein [Lactobacillus sp. 0.1XD8-4]
MGKDYSLSSELCLSNWTAEALDNSAKHWVKNRNQLSSASAYVISDEDCNFLKIDFEDPVKQANVLKINRVPLALATVFKTIQSANAVINFLKAVGIKEKKELHVRRLRSLLH